VAVARFVHNCGVGFGEAWRGLALYRHYVHLRHAFDALALPIEGSKEQSKGIVKWPGGETLHFRLLQSNTDYWRFHGHAYPWIAVYAMTPELDETVDALRQAVNKSEKPDVPISFLVCDG